MSTVWPRPLAAINSTKSGPISGLALHLDPDLIASVMIEAEAVTKKGDDGVKAMGVSLVGPDMLDAVVRLVRLAGKYGHPQRVLSAYVRMAHFYRWGR